MKHTTTWTKWLGIGAITLVAASGCADRNDNGQPDSVATSGEVSNAVGDAGNTAAKAGDAVGNAVGDAGKAVEGAADAALNTPKIKSAIAANASLKGTTIDVDTNGTKDTITLKGTVKNAAQKTAAGMIAKKNAPNYKIVNNLTVAGGASPKKN